MKRADRRLYIAMVGLPASGKSTLTQIICDLTKTRIPLYVLSTDNFIQARADEKRLTYNDVFKDTIKEATSDMKQTRLDAIQSMAHIIHDQTNLGIEKRQSMISELPDFYRKVCVYFEMPEEMRQRNLKSRPDKIIPPSIDASMKASYTRPTIDEGWNDVVSSDEVLAYCTFRSHHNHTEDLMEQMFGTPWADTH